MAAKESFLALLHDTTLMRQARDKVVPAARCTFRDSNKGRKIGKPACASRGSKCELFGAKPLLKLRASLLCSRATGQIVLQDASVAQGRRMHVCRAGPSSLQPVLKWCVP